MSLLRDSIALYRAHGYDGFLRRQTQAVLLHIRQTLGENDTVPLTVSFPELLAKASPADVDVIPLIKRAGGGASDAITVGRTDQSDISLPYHDISKDHAYFTFNSVAGTYSVTDVGSRNGTAVDGKVLEKHKARVLDDGADIAFARIHCCFMLPEGFAMLLKWVKIPD